MLNLYKQLSDEFHISFPKYMPKVCNEDSKVAWKSFFFANLERFFVICVINFEHVFAQ